MFFSFFKEFLGVGNSHRNYYIQPHSDHGTEENPSQYYGLLKKYAMEYYS